MQKAKADDGKANNVSIPTSDKDGKTFLYEKEKESVIEREISLCNYFALVMSEEMSAAEYKKLLKAIEYHYNSKKFTNGKEEKKSDKRGIKIIKEFLLEMYKKFGAVKKKNDDE